MFYVEEFEVEAVGERKTGGGVEGGNAVEEEAGGVEEFVAVNEVFTGKGGGKESATFAEDGGEVVFGGKAVKEVAEGAIFCYVKNTSAVGGVGWRAGGWRARVPTRRIG